MEQFNKIIYINSTLQASFLQQAPTDALHVNYDKYFYYEPNCRYVVIGYSWLAASLMHCESQGEWKVLPQRVTGLQAQNWTLWTYLLCWGQIFLYVQGGM